MAQEALKWAFIGTGGISKAHLHGLDELRQRGLDDCVIVAACDKNEENARAFAADVQKRYGWTPKVYTDYKQMLDSEKLDVVDICLPHGLHHSVAIDCMEAGVDVLCEKPLGITIKASRLMCESADRTGRVLSTAVPYRRLPGQRAVHWVLNESGLIGKPQSFFHQYTQAPRPRPVGAPTEVPPAVRWRRDRLMSGGGPTMDGGFHYCDSIRYFLGEVDKIYAEARSFGGGNSVGIADANEDTVFVTFSFKSGVVGNWSYSLTAPGEPIAKVVFYGSEGSISDRTPSGAIYKHLFWRSLPNLMEDGLLTKSDGSTLTLAEVEKLHLEAIGEEKREKLFPKGLEEGFGFEMWEFMKAVRGDKKVEVDGWDGLRSLAVCEAIYESAFLGQAVSVDDVVSGKTAFYQQAINEHWKI